MEIQTNTRQHSVRKIKNHNRVTFVRDPIDYFLSGWAECGFRWHKSRIPELKEMAKENSDDALSPRIFEYGLQRRKEPRSNCLRHAFLSSGKLCIEQWRGSKQSKKKIGDLREISGVLLLVGFPYNHSKTRGKDASQSKLKTTYYPSRKNLISNVTMLEICQFVAIDYFLFDFEPPEACRGQGALLDFSVAGEEAEAE
jgi:hypothetical protein